VDCDNCFEVRAEVCETCDDTGLLNVTANLSFTGDAMLKPGIPGNTLTQTVCPYLDPGECKEVVWTLCCTGDTDVHVIIEVNGYDAYSGALRTDTVEGDVEQLTDLKVEITEPTNKEAKNVCETFPVTVNVTNCRDLAQDDEIFAGIELVADGDCPLNLEMADMTADIVYCPDSHLPPQTDVPVTQIAGTNCYTVPLMCVCECCWAEVTFMVTCNGSGMDNCEWVCEDEIRAFAGTGPASCDGLDDDSITVKQMCKAHLAGSVHAFEGTIAIDNFEGCELLKAVTPCEDFTIVATIANQGEATAENVSVTLGFEGNAVTQMPLTMELGDIECHGAAKAMWEFHCEGEGEVDFWIESISGEDANYEAPIHASNIEKGCPITVDQIPLEIEIIQPLTCTDFVEKESFTVKAKITNFDSDMTLDDVKATLHWDSEDPLDCDPDPCCGDFVLTGTPKTVDVTEGDDTLLPGEWAEVTWQVKCCCAGDVTFWVDVTAVTVPKGYSLDIQSGPETIHQWEPGRIKCRILSPDLHDFDVCREK
jgi:hypothetical protein